jgi:glycoside/pentoside/hexuronide:cation symporter, GPH family
MIIQSFAGPSSMIMVVILLSSMMADQVEETERRTGKRSEGLLLATSTFVRKLAMGLGVMIAGLILTHSSFPQNAGRTELEASEQFHTMMAYLISKIILFTGATTCLSLFRDQNECFTPHPARSIPHGTDQSDLP